MPRKRPSPEERIELVVPASLKDEARERADAAKMSLAMFVRMALLREIREPSIVA